MAKKSQERAADGNGKFRIKTLSDLIGLNIATLEDVVNSDTDLKKAALIFTGSRTITASLKLGLEAMKLGMKSVSGVDIDNNIKQITEEEPPQ